jgi:hypothetical protein
MAQSRTPPLVFACLLLACLGFLFAFGHAAQSEDFRSFYVSGESWWAGADPYPRDPSLRPNLNSPPMVVWVYAPMSLLPRKVVAPLWLIAGAVSVIAALRVIERTLALSRVQTQHLAAVLLVGWPAFIVWFEGQNTAVLMYPMTKAWAAYRSDQAKGASAWLAPAIVVKPFLVVMLPFLRFATAWRTALWGLTICGVTLAVTGLPLWFAWWETSEVVAWLPWATNASLWAVLARSLGHGPSDPVTIAQLGLWRLLIVPVASLLAWIIWQVRDDRDSAWVGSGLLAILLSPIGWVFCVGWFAGALAAIPVSRPLATFVIVGLSAPVYLLSPWSQLPSWWYAVLGSLNAWALLAYLVTIGGHKSGDRSRLLRTSSPSSSG